MLRLATIFRSVALAAPVLLLTVLIWRTTTVRIEMTGSLAEGVVMAVACMFWFPMMKEPKFSPRARKPRR